MTFHGLGLGAFTPQGSYALLLLVGLGCFLEQLQQVPLSTNMPRVVCVL